MEHSLLLFITMVRSTFVHQASKVEYTKLHIYSVLSHYLINNLIVLPEVDQS